MNWITCDQDKQSESRVQACKSVKLIVTEPFKGNTSADNYISICAYFCSQAFRNDSQPGDHSLAERFLTHIDYCHRLPIAVKIDHM